MHQSAPLYRRDSPTRHPPYGLYLDPHRGQHNWTAASKRVILGFITLLGGFLLVVALGPR